MFSGIFSQAIVYLLAAIVSVPLAKRLGLGSALGYIIAGIVIGPFVLGFVGQEGQDVMHFAEFGVVLMLFLVGLELNPERLWRMRVPILGLGGSQVLVTAAVLAGLAYALGQGWQAALATGLILSLSSTAMVLQTLKERAWMHTEAGKAGFSVLLFQDIAVIPILTLLPFLAVPELLPSAPYSGAGLENDLRPGWLKALMVLTAVLVIVIGGRYLLRPLFHWVAGTRSIELFIAMAMALVVAVTLAMEFVGLSPALGTFLAGVVLADSEFRHELESSIDPFKGLLLGLFFMMVGASIDFRLVASAPLYILALVFALIACKFLVLLVLGRLFRLNIADNLMFSFLLAQGGEFAFLLASFAVQSQVISAEFSNKLIVIVVLSMVVTPLLLILYERWVQPRFLDCVTDEPGEEEPIERCPVIVAGFGRFGQIVSRLLHADGIGTTLLDYDAGQIQLTGRFGYKVFFGDASRVELLTAAGAGDARLLVVAIGSRESALRVVETAKRHFPDLKILVRAHDRSNYYELKNAGADIVIRETFGSALLMGEQALRLLGYGEDRAYRVMRAFKQHDEEAMDKLQDVWGDDVEYGMRQRGEIAHLVKVLRDDRDDPGPGPEGERQAPDATSS
jgi:monovalent cation:proton antiporter-2 (CPA2) family protein